MVKRLEMSQENEKAKSKNVIVFEAIAKDALFLKYKIEEEELYSAAEHFMIKDGPDALTPWKILIELK